MALELIRAEPKIEDFTPLSSHQEQTPNTFFGGPPVLHYHSPTATLSLDTDAQNAHPAFTALTTQTGPAKQVNGEADSLQRFKINNLSLWITSESVIFFNPTVTTGVKIPYPAICMHARSGSTVSIELMLGDSRHTADEDLQTFEMGILPSVRVGEGSTDTSGSGDELQEAEKCYEAISACADLWPDPDEDDEGLEEGGQPGEGGWITAENMHEFMDEDGNLRLPEMNGEEEEAEGVVSLGPGAGSRRTADDAAGETNGVDGEEDDETKWRRTG